MKKVIFFAALTVLLAGCGTAAKLEEDRTVNIGYGTIDKEALTSSVSTLKSDRKKTETYLTIYDYLRGRVPGVVVSPDNRILIRGINSINSTSDPLILVDGQEVTTINSLNPADIKSVDVIKDGSSAIYGVRGANGVILITTKGH